MDKYNVNNDNLIAEFMGYTIRIMHDTSSYGHGGASYRYCKDGVTTNAVYYSKSWEWLMDVVEQIEKTEYGSCVNGFCTSITDSWCYISNVHEMDTQVEFKSMVGLGISKKEAVYNLVLEFINWYNILIIK